MSMSVEQRRVEVLEFTGHLHQADVRLIKASSRYDRRRRLWVVEVRSRSCRTSKHRDLLWIPIADWPVSDKGSGSDAREYYDAAVATIYALDRS